MGVVPPSEILSSYWLKKKVTWNYNGYHRISELRVARPRTAATKWLTLAARDESPLTKFWGSNRGSLPLWEHLDIGQTFFAIVRYVCISQASRARHHRSSGVFQTLSLQQLPATGAGPHCSPCCCGFHFLSLATAFCQRLHDAPMMDTLWLTPAKPIQLPST